MEDLNAKFVVEAMGKEEPRMIFNKVIEHGNVNEFIKQVVFEAIECPSIEKVGIRSMGKLATLYSFETDIDSLYDMSICVWNTSNKATLHIDFTKAVKAILECINTGKVDDAVHIIYELKMDKENALYLPSTIYDMIHFMKCQDVAMKRSATNNPDIIFGKCYEISMTYNTDKDCYDVTTANKLKNIMFLK